MTKTSSIGDPDIMDNDKDEFGLGIMLVSLNSLLVMLIIGRFIKEVAFKLAQRCCDGSCSQCCCLQCCTEWHKVDENQELLL